MLSDTCSRPSIPVSELLRVSGAELRASAEEHLALPKVRSEARKLLARLDTWAALAVVALASSAVWYLGNVLIERWELR